MSGSQHKAPGYAGGYLQKRIEEIHKVQQVVGELKGHRLESTAKKMAIPIFYAHWEGFVKEALQDYLRFVQELNIPQKDVAPALLAYSWSSNSRKLANNLSFESQLEMAKCALTVQTKNLQFHPEEAEIKTKSNLKFKVLDTIFKWLCLDTTAILDEKKHIDALVNRRNEIAHGGRSQEIDSQVIEEIGEKVIELMTCVEAAITTVVEQSLYLNCRR